MHNIIYIDKSRNSLADATHGEYNKHNVYLNMRVFQLIYAGNYYNI